MNKLVIIGNGFDLAQKSNHLIQFKPQN